MKQRMTPNDRQYIINNLAIVLSKYSSERLRPLDRWPWHPADVAHCIRLAAISLGEDLADQKDGELQFCTIDLWEYEGE